jgi:ribosomal protein L37AE/L43A
MVERQSAGIIDAMSPGVPVGDTERVQLSGPLTLSFSIGWVALCLGAMAVVAVAQFLAAGGDTLFGAVLLGLVFVAGVVGWRWVTPLRGVVATRTGILVKGLRGARFVPYASVASVRENQLSRLRTTTVTLREPDGPEVRFAFVPPYRPGLGIHDAHPEVRELLRRLPPSRCDECGSPFVQGSTAMLALCAECSHLLYGYTACRHDFDPGGACRRCGWNGARSAYTSKLAG